MMATIHHHSSEKIPNVQRSHYYRLMRLISTATQHPDSHLDLKCLKEALDCYPDGRLPKLQLFHINCALDVIPVEAELRKALITFRNSLLMHNWYVGPYHLNFFLKPTKCA
jgi:hypothetical protein